MAGELRMVRGRETMKHQRSWKIQNPMNLKKWACQEELRSVSGGDKSKDQKVAHSHLIETTIFASLEYSEKEKPSKPEGPHKYTHASEFEQQYQSAPSCAPLMSLTATRITHLAMIFLSPNVPPANKVTKARIKKLMLPPKSVNLSVCSVNEMRNNEA